VTSYHARIPSRRQVLAGASVALLAFALAACGTTSDREGPRRVVERGPAPVAGRLPPGSQVKIAILLPLSGDRANLGRAMQRAAEMAVLEQGAKNMQLVTFDTRGTPEGAAAAAEQAMQQDAKLILGPVFAGEVRAVRERVGGKINVIAFSNDQAVAGSGVYLLSFSTKQQIENVIGYAARNGRKRIGIIAPANEYGQQITSLAKEVASKNGAEITRTGTYKPDTMEVTDDIKAFAGATGVDRKGRVGRAAPLDFDAVLIADGGTKLRMVASLLAYYDVDPDKVRYLGTGRWDDKALRRELSLRGGWYAAPDPTSFERFAGKFKGLHGDEPPRIATLAYDAVALAGTIAKKPDGIDYSAQTLTDPSGFAGIDGIFRFTADGQSERGLAVVEIGRDEVKVVGEPPRSFAPTGPGPTN
jgi:branched-chain amino acid transport system substrate-binding protein